MNAASPVTLASLPDAPQPWSRRRLLGCVGLLFAGQLALIFALGERGPTKPRAPAAAPVLRVAPQPAETLALEDPTLFALPHPSGFAGRAWLRPPTLQVQSRRWTESPRWLAPAPDSFGITVPELARAHRPLPLEVTVNPIPEVASTLQPEPMPAPPSRSTLALADDLGGRRLLNPPELPAWPAADLLTNSVVRVLVNGDGLVRSATLLGRSGSTEADEFALAVARAARFEPTIAAAGTPALQLGTMIFLWSTVPLTNAPASLP
jgi:TonB family protein